MMKINRNHEHGQITVLMVFAIIALFGSAALAIDGGMLYFQRRAAQSAADNAVMTGALAIFKGYDSAQTETIVLESTKRNGFDNSADDVEVYVYWPPQAPNAYAGNTDFIQVIITSRIPLAFIQFVYQGPVEVTVEAVAHVRENAEIAPGNAIFASNPQACWTLDFYGTADFEISGGGSVHSNSDCSCGSGANTGSIEVTVEDGGIVTSVGCWDSAGSGSVDPAPITTSPQTLNQVPLLDCSGLPNQDPVNTNNEETIQPGVYEYMKLTSGAIVTMEPGIYCMSGSRAGRAISVNSGSTLQGDGVTIYFMESAGDFSAQGGATVNLTAPTDLKDESGNQWAGMLFYTHPNNSNEITVTGGGSSWYEGTIYGLGSHCQVEGNGSVFALGSQIICDSVGAGGNGALTLIYDPGSNYKVPAMVDLSQ